MSAQPRSGRIVQPMSPAMEQCIQNCTECHRVCIETSVYCLQQGGKHAEAAHIRSLLDCAQLCALTADFMMRGSDLHPQTCGVCAEACARCAESCEQFGDDRQMQTCAEMCHRCEQSCRQMASMPM